MDTHTSSTAKDHNRGATETDDEATKSIRRGITAVTKINLDAPGDLKPHIEGKPKEYDSVTSKMSIDSSRNEDVPEHPKPTRYHYTISQRRQLRELYKTHGRKGSKGAKAIAQELGVSPHQVMDWFRSERRQPHSEAWFWGASIKTGVAKRRTKRSRKRTKEVGASYGSLDAKSA
ncbi:uncharacterized protein LY89DRAFT_738517 [Mollisia scopiformis]|uniref:Homeobox domain-containing protein n=1 Tax=Mollisia scopiformis TaxID=149040 RepID=A0A194WW25_MOLSC|nr:uncharacterized protein LY89DRAFT_738517 [Mollisia scopiformis]KUJ11874.1 hypothetical protein LY89DRAFT_738517 [Mollisia scopiformis]